MSFLTSKNLILDFYEKYNFIPNLNRILYILIHTF